jgi:hypothetical protein
MNNLSICAQVGALNGIVIGFGFGILQIETSGQPINNSDLNWVILILAGLATLVSLFVLLVLRKYTFNSVFWATLINALLVSLVVIVTLNIIGTSAFSALLGVVLGFLLGLLMGWLLCRLCGQRFIPGNTGNIRGRG